MQNGYVRTTIPLSDLKGLYHGHDIWLLAAGASLDHVDPGFFENKLTVGINHVFCRFSSRFIVVRDHNFFEDCYQAAVKSDSCLIAARLGFLGPGRQVPNEPAAPIMEKPYVNFDTAWAAPAGLDLDLIGSDQMIAGMSTIHTALHVCAYLGAANVILCGADGGTLDGRRYFDGYRDGSSPNVADDQFTAWLAAVEAQTLAIRARLKAVYGCNVVSLNPFINFGLEGHKYDHL